MPRPRLRTLFYGKTQAEKAEVIKHLIWLEEHTCIRHNVAYCHHPNCYEREYPNTEHTENIGFLDIEATNLKADFGVMICYCIKPARRDKIIQRCVKPSELKKSLDREVVAHLIQKLPYFDRIITHYGSRFDIPFIRSRALNLGLDFPAYKSNWQTDTWRIARQKLCISSNRLANIAKLLGVKEQKTPITSEHWLGALMGKKASLKYILEHCQKDVLILEEVYNKIWPFAPRSKTSI